MIYGLTYLQWFFVIFYLIIAYITYNYFLDKNRKFNKPFIDKANRHFIIFIIFVYPGIVFFTNPYEFISISTKVIMLYLAYLFIIIYYLNLLIFYYKDKKIKFK